MLYSGLVRRLALSCALLAIPALAVAQFDSGSFIGTVHDSAGAVVPDATVVVTNPQTGVSVTRTTDSSGAWEVPSLHTGTYTVKISHGGFSDAAANDVTLSVGARQRIDLTLNAAGSSETVEVSGVALQLETENSERGQTITGYQSAALPLVSRNYSDLLGLVTGVRQAPTSATTSSINSLTRAGSYNVNGQRSMFNNFLLDGMDNNAYGESNQGFDNQIIAIRLIPSPSSRSSPTTRAPNTAAHREPPSMSLRTAARTSSTRRSTSSSATLTSTPPATFSQPSSATPARSPRSRSRRSTAISSAATSAAPSSRTSSSSSWTTKASVRL